MSRRICDLSTEYGSVPIYPEDDRICTPLTVCSDEEFQTVSPTHISDRECAQCTGCEVRLTADLAFIFDVSASVEDPVYGGSPGNFGLQKSFASEVTGLLEIGLDSVRVAGLTYGSEANLAFDLLEFSYSTEAVQDAIARIAFPDGTQSTRVDLAIRAAAELLRDGNDDQGFG